MFDVEKVDTLPNAFVVIKLFCEIEQSEMGALLLQPFLNCITNYGGVFAEFTTKNRLFIFT